jgi:hypothetical protein
MVGGAEPGAEPGANPGASYLDFDSMDVVEEALRASTGTLLYDRR